jgi:phosphopantetheine adenylyltransferase
MRYIEIDNIEFTTKEGNTVIIKDIREIPDYQTLVNINYKNEDIDEIISRTNYYGDGSEDLTYSVVEHNKIKIDEENYILSGLKTLKIPAV